MSVMDGFYLDAARGDDADTAAWEDFWGDAIEDDSL